MQLFNFVQILIFNYLTGIYITLLRIYAFELVNLYKDIVLSDSTTHLYNVVYQQRIIIVIKINAIRFASIKSLNFKVTLIFLKQSYYMLPRIILLGVAIILLK